jgi:hypothetical protein
LKSILAHTEVVPEPAEESITEWLTYKYNGAEGFEIDITKPAEQ